SVPRRPRGRAIRAFPARRHGKRPSPPVPRQRREKARGRVRNGFPAPASPSKRTARQTAASPSSGRLRRRTAWRGGTRSRVSFFLEQKEDGHGRYGDNGDDSG